MTQPIDPTLLNPGTDASVPLTDFVAPFDDGIKNADTQLEAAKARATTAANALAAVPAGLVNDDARKAAQDELAKASTVVEQAAKEATDARTRKAVAVERYSQRGNIPQELRDRYAAMAEAEKANAAKVTAETQEFLNNAPDRQAALHATTLKTTADAAVAQAQADLATATTPIQKQQAQAALDLAQQNVKNAQANYASVQAGTGETIARTAQTGVQTDLVRQQVRTAQAQADVAPQAAQAAVDQAQANVAKTNQEIADLQRQARQAPDDAQAQQAIQTQLAQKQTELQQAQQNLQQAQQLLPGVVAQQGANLAQTQAGTAATRAGMQKDLLGNLYGLQDKIKAIGDALRSGQITDPAAAQQQLDQYIQATIAGTTPFEATKTALDAETQRRQQDYSLAASQGSTFGSGFGTALGQFSKLNDTTPVGSDSAGRGFLASLDLLQNGIRSFQPNVPMNSPLLQSISNLGTTPSVNATAFNQMQNPAASAAAPTTQISPDGTVTIQHTQAQPSAAGLLAPGMAGTNADPMVAGSPAFLSADSPALPHHVDALWQNDPNLNPLNSASLTAS